MKTQEYYLDYFKSQLNSFLDRMETEPKFLYEPVRYALSAGGKRIRPVMCLMSAEMFGASADKAIDAALGLEIFHNFTLLHDDIMDKSDMRRGRPTVHKKWTENIAILSGDLMSLVACKCAARTEINHDKVLETFLQTAIEICEGQQYDMDFETESNVTVDDYMKMINLKTAVLLAGSLKIGALIADASPNDCENIYQYGRYAGLAFQLQDDLLDTYGDAKVFGKPIGGDITENKKTFLLINAMNLASGKEKEELTEWLSKENFDRNEKYNSVRSIYNSLKIKEMTIAKIEECYNIADSYLQKVSIPESQKSVLRNYIDAMRTRNY
ncbi:MAG: polyprenyl synthetase family protein [Bacteroidales bacterium]|nr:polyprenyl synthetase family protein [Bacteroidales bacterium]